MAPSGRARLGEPNTLLFVREVERPLRYAPCQLGARAHSELPIDPSEMHLDGSNRGEELCRNLAVRPAGRNESRHTALGARQLAVTSGAGSRAA
jgi:hypothetical protein